MSVTRPCFTTRHQTCKTKTKTKTDFLVSDRSCHNWAFTQYDRRTDRSVRLVYPTSRMKRLVTRFDRRTECRSDPGYVRLVCQTSRMVGQTVAEPPTYVNQINVGVAC